MAKINLDFTSNVDILCREGDTFDFNLSLSNSDGSAFTIQDNELVVFSIYNNDGNLMRFTTSFLHDAGLVAPVYGSRLTWPNEGSFNDNAESNISAKTFADLLDAPLDIFFFESYDTFVYMANHISSGVSGAITLYPITFSSDGLKIYIESYMFNIPAGKYRYDLKIVSEPSTRSSEFMNDSGSAATKYYFKHSNTWLSGKLIVNKN